MNKECSNCKGNCSNEVEYTDVHKGMQKLLVEAVTSYLFSEEANLFGVNKLVFEKIVTEDSIRIESSFLVKESDNCLECEDEGEDYEDEDYEDEEDEDTLNAKKDFAEFLIDFYKFLEAHNGEDFIDGKTESKPKSKRGRKKKSTEE